MKVLDLFQLVSWGIWMKRFVSGGKGLSAALALLVGFLVAMGGATARSMGGFAGVEYLSNDSQISRQEVEKILGLHHGASYEAAERALERLRDKFEQRRMHANLEIVDGDKDEFYVSVDIVKAGVAGDAPTRKLEFMRRVFLTNTKPLTLLEQLETRRMQLQEQGRPTAVVYKDGVKHYSDVACDRIVDQLLTVTPLVRGQLCQMVSSDPDPRRRMAAIELLNWAGAPVADAVEVMPAINDVDADVRVVAAKYVIARVDLLPDRFPWTQLIEAYAFQLVRPSHRDRISGLACLAAMSKARPELAYNIKVYSEERLKLLMEQSSIPAIRSHSQDLLARVGNVKEPQRKVSPGEFNGF